MKIERAGRYKDKLNLVSKRVEQVQGWLQQISAEEFLEDDKTRLASFKAFQEAVGLSRPRGHDVQRLRNCAQR
jgi:hypothetical protein